VRFLALGGLLGPALFTIVTIVCGSLRPDYSHASQFVSELGARGTRNAAVMNLLGFVPTGFLLAAFGVALARLLDGGASAVAGSLLLAGFGAGLVAAGSLPCEPGCPQQAPTLHDSVSIAGFLAAIAGFALLARLFRHQPSWRPLWLYSALTSAVALVWLVALAHSIDAREWTGLWQRLLIGTLFLGCAVLGWRAFHLAKPEAGRGSSGR